MKRRYYYLVASLPGLSFNAPPPFDIKALQALCRPHLKRSDFALLASLILLDADSGDKTPLPAVKRWLEWERLIRNELVRLRAERLGLDPAEYLRGDRRERGLTGLARKVFDAASPIEAERIFDEERWGHLDHLEYGHYFDIERLAIYCLKLQILERRALLDAERGFKMVSSIIDKAEYMESWKDTE